MYAMTLAKLLSPESPLDKKIREVLEDHFGGSSVEGLHLWKSRASSTPEGPDLNTPPEAAETLPQHRNALANIPLESESLEDLSLEDLLAQTGETLEAILLEGIKAYSEYEAKKILTEKKAEQLIRFILASNILFRGQIKSPTPGKHPMTLPMTNLVKSVQARSLEMREAHLVKALELLPLPLIESTLIKHLGPEKSLSLVGTLFPKTPTHAETPPAREPLRLIDRLIVSLIQQAAANPSPTPDSTRLIAGLQRIIDGKPLGDFRALPTSPATLPRNLYTLVQALPAAVSVQTVLTLHKSPEVPPRLFEIALQSAVRPALEPGPLSPRSIQIITGLQQNLPDFPRHLENAGLTVDVRSAVNSLTQHLSSSLDAARPSISPRATQDVESFIHQVRLVSPDSITRSNLESAVVAPLTSAREQLIERAQPESPQDLRLYAEVVGRSQQTTDSVQQAPSKITALTTQVLETSRTPDAAHASQNPRIQRASPDLSTPAPPTSSPLGVRAVSYGRIDLPECCQEGPDISLTERAAILRSAHAEARNILDRLDELTPSSQSRFNISLLKVRSSEEQKTNT